ncbi:carbohydrate ABC transporter permease [Brevibacillus migulae]|uniref:carbohydrate ABC transporter permease n=1 Tax=Brevibacillus migulae TaxID=1644114 RepID=UPI00106EE8E9|nr:carbohydrate ABC transporter permease [Brevibacillus migulae]
MGKGLRQDAGMLLVYVLLGIGALISIYPFYWMFTASTLTEGDIFKTSSAWLPGGNFLENLRGLESSMPVWRALLNSLIVSGVTTISTVFLSALAGYAFAKFSFKGREILFFLVLMTMMIPAQVTLVPLFIIMMKLEWINTYYALILPNMVTGFGVFLMRQQMMGFPDELIESARMDGSSEFGTFLRIVLPTMKPACAALGIVTFMNQWGNFLWPLVAVNDKEMLTLPLMLSMMVAPGNVVKYGEVMAGSVIGLVPIIILFLFFRKYFVSGAFSGSVKG